jgi:hypothetical protein
LELAFLEGQCGVPLRSHVKIGCAPHELYPVVITGVTNMMPEYGAENSSPTSADLKLTPSKGWR